MSANVSTPAAAATRGGTPAAAGVAPEARRRRRIPGSGLRWLSPVLLLVLWQVLSATGVLPEKTLAGPAQIFSTAVDLTRSGELPEALWISLQRALLGLVFGTIAAIVFGIAAGVSKFGDLAVDPPMQMIRTIPLFGLVPLFILWFGIGETPKVLLVALGVVVPLYLNLVAALRSVDPELLEVADTLRLSRVQRWRHVIVPSVLPAALVGFRQSLGIAWLALIVAEQIAASEGLGYMINNARDFLQTDIIVVGLLAYALLGLITDGLVRVLEKRALRYRDEGVLA